MFACVTQDFDVVVIGGGPAGAAVANLLAQAGHGVALFERKALPRFHVGESLIPAVNLTLAKLGVLDRMDGRRFPRKHGVQFFSPRGPGRPFYFSELGDPRLHQTWQVLRSDFDAMLVDRARQVGVTVATDTPVVDVATTTGVVDGVRVRRDDGGEERIGARVVIDASGQQAVIVQRFGGRSNIEGLENMSVFTHYVGAALDDGIDAGSTLIYRLEGSGWLWFIPLPDGASVGLVAPAADFAARGDSGAEILDASIAACPPLQERLRNACRTIDVVGAQDFTYRANRDGGAGWLAVGDALGFIDPMYSTGVFLTFLSAELAAAAVDSALRAGRKVLDFAGYACAYDVAFDRFLGLVLAFYRPGFSFSEFAKSSSQRQGLVDLLSGIVDSAEAIQVAGALRDMCKDKIA